MAVRIAIGNIAQSGVIELLHMNISTAPLATGELIYDDSLWSFDEAIGAFDAPQVAGLAKRGRGEVRYLRLPFAEAVLRKYQRGGMAARVSQDWYVWRGREATRPFREFRLTAHLRAQGMPVPRPLAARYVRSGLGYRAELITERIQNAVTLAECVLARRSIDWAALGRTFARFHAAGFWHADLNAHNVMIDSQRRGWLIDWDRGRLRVPAEDWKQNNLDRLLRSLRKLGANEHVDDFSASAWAQLLAAYHAD
jgi:3-deoxy-D-manno-octulosonic acid kinase